MSQPNLSRTDIRCLYCGGMRSPRRRKCPNCGATARPAVSPQLQPSTRPRKQQINGRDVDWLDGLMVMLSLYFALFLSIAGYVRLGGTGWVWMFAFFLTFIGALAVYLGLRDGTMKHP